MTKLASKMLSGKVDIRMSPDDFKKLRALERLLGESSSEVLRIALRDLYRAKLGKAAKV